jgi:uncharacterized protein YcaQ
MPERTLSTRQLNRALLARQLLLEPSELPLTDAIEQVGGLQTQYAPSAYIGLWSRLRSFRREELTRALEQRLVVQATLMRATIHVVSARDFGLLAAAIRRGRRESWLRLQAKGLSGIDLGALGARVRGLLADGPLRQAELIERLLAEGHPRIALATAGMLVDLVRVPPSGTWERRRADLYGLADDWLDEPDRTEAEGQEHLVRGYLGAFGPATMNDLASWAGLPVATLKPVAQRVGLRRFVDERGTELIDLPGAPLPDPDAPAPVRFLPTWDATLLVHARRTQLLPERYRPRIFSTRTPQSVPTFLIDGAVAGTWRYHDGRVLVEPFEPLPSRARRELDEAAMLLAGFHAS